MLRFFGICVLLAVGSAAAIVLASDRFQWVKPVSGKKLAAQVAHREADANSDNNAREEQEPAPVVPSTGRFFDAPVRITESGETGASLPLILQGGRVLPLERREVPSEREGKLSLLATPVPESEFVPKDKLEMRRVPLLVVPWRPGDDKLIAQDKEFGLARQVLAEPFKDPDAGANEAGRWYRLPRPGDRLEPGTTKIIRLPIKFRRLSEDDYVEAGQMIGVINPAVAFEELGIKQAQVEAAAAEVKSAASLKAEAMRREMAMKGSRQKMRGSVSDDDYYAAVVTVERYAAEEVAKAAAVIKAQQELSAAWTTLDLYFIKAPISGRIRSIYKQQGEAVKQLEAVLQLQNTKQLRVEAQIEVQDALPLQQRVRRAEALRLEAKQIEATNPNEANAKRKQADELTRVYVEITRPVPPMAVLPGHAQEVTCIAVTGEELPRIVSGGEEGTVRIWERIIGEDRWNDKFRLSHGAPIRAVATTTRGAKHNLLLTATSRGQVRIFNLSDLNTNSEPVLCGKGDDRARHLGPVNVIAVNSEGTLAATGGEDRSIIFWSLPSGEKIESIKDAHNAHITWIAFAPGGKVVSASRGKSLKIWEKKDGKWSAEELPGRSDEVATLSINPKDNTILVDGERELRVYSLDTHQLKSTIVNHGTAGAFSTMALFSPDGNTILTNGNGPGRLQLWRAPSKSARAAELRQFLWSTGTVTCGAFDPKGEFAVTGTTDHRVLVWQLPRAEEAEKPSEGQLTYVEENLDSGLRSVTVRATITDAPEGVNPGSAASIVVPPRPR